MSSASNIISRTSVAFLCGMLLAAIIATFHIRRLEARHKAQLDYETMTARCFTYWGRRSPVSDAEVEFSRGRIGLLQETGNIDDAITFIIPGLKDGAVADVRLNFPLVGPKLDGLDRDEHTWPPHQRECERYPYSFDYNVTMLRLQGRDKDIQLRPSTELK